MPLRKDGDSVVIPARKIRPTPIWSFSIALLALSGFSAVFEPFWPLMIITLGGTIALSMSAARAASRAAHPWIGGPSRFVRLTARDGDLVAAEMDGAAIEPISPWRFEHRELITRSGSSRFVHYLIYLVLPERVIELHRAPRPSAAQSFLDELSDALGIKRARLRPEPTSILMFSCGTMLALVAWILFGVALAMGAGFYALRSVEEDPSRFWVGVPAALAFVVYDALLYVSLRKSTAAAAREHVANEHLDPRRKIR